MTDKKYTDEEIEKALSLCGRTTEVVYCDQCPLCGEYECNREIKVLALGLINRQKAEIERLKECPKCVYEYDGEVMEYCVQGACPNFKTVEQIKSEAYKEFAEKLKKDLFYRCGDIDYSETCDLRKLIDNLLKETVGEED